MQLQGKKTLVLGAGKSGVAASRFLAERGAIVALHDKKPLAEWSEQALKLKDKYRIGLICGQIPSWLLDQIELLVVSPGVPTNSIPVRYVDRKGAEVIGEVELAYRFLKGKIVGITGTNGKTTTTTLIGEILKSAGFKVQVAGNIGTPLIEVVGSSDDETWNVIELSSFQLETISLFRPNIAVALNVTPNHLDRYNFFSDYAAAKHRIFMNQTSEDIAILNADNEVTASWAKGLKAKVVLFSAKNELDEGFFLRGDEIIFRDGISEKVVSRRSEILLKGLHNLENVLASVAAATFCGVDFDVMRDVLSRFQGVEHRLELVGSIRGVRFYNDSKATSVDATLKALEALGGESGKIVLILGGRGKNAPYKPLIQLVEKLVRAIVLIGEDADRIEAELSGKADMTRANSMEDAVRKAFQMASENDIVLLSPACASFDMFESFEHRGRAFKQAFLKLKEEES
ncbi:MAG: UDP-N-acetylmuramoyl-L-alanine--D-glutamate ligase [Pyrinomonadaceae bacterium]|nr:UDP-N-acetylmuramoyl-L-alanine--D-glutamate ligase [Pyrinomonadaceae bacterium]MCX7639776.1 UDP-N-acetylmuramoyl-L-alanine--D-glutamate ligase [Pyrinomonadaceae bacterium]MDW8304359.1 UDP-N-acetylmuramoyl-L-alanine--D-glutamate ligase [Acidobacteriota bacterium]